MLETPPLSLYVHIPWCVRKCPYCDFNSHQVRQTIPEAEYVSALCADLKFEVDRLEQTRPLHSIFFGGGTPSLFRADSYEKFLECADQLLGIDSECEITLEANPGTADAENFRGFRSAGINRLSLGIQSFSDSHLKELGRIHSAAEAEAAVKISQASGFDNFNLDLMYGLPNQSVEGALEDLQKALNLGPTHLSWYQLTIEPNTEFHSRPPKLPKDSITGELQDQGIALLASAGFDRYEVSAYSQTGKQALHNTNYWEFGDYLGIGAGAHGKLTSATANAIVRTRKKRQPDHYLSATLNRDAERKEVPDTELAFEFLLNALRLRHGFAVELFEKRTGVTFRDIGKKVEYLSSQGLLSTDNGRIRTTDRGFRVLNSLLEEFLD